MNERYSQGYSLLEVLIAAVVIGVGVIGVAGMQIIGLRHTHSAHLLTQANILGNDMAERMRASMARVDSGSHDVFGGALEDPGCAAGRDCSPAQPARYDAQAWTSAVAAELPNGVGALTRNAEQGTFTIRITWDERQDGGESISPKSYIMTFRP